MTITTDKTPGITLALEIEKIIKQFRRGLISEHECNFCDSNTYKLNPLHKGTETRFPFPCFHCIKYLIFSDI